MTDLVERLKRLRDGKIVTHDHKRSICDAAITALTLYNKRIAEAQKHLESALLEALEYGFLEGQDSTELDACTKDWKHQSTLVDTAYLHTNKTRQVLKGDSNGVR